MKKCPKCGKENDDDAIFCDACDWKLNMRYAKDGEAKYLINSRTTEPTANILELIRYFASPSLAYLILSFQSQASQKMASSSFSFPHLGCLLSLTLPDNPYKYYLACPFPCEH